MEEASPRLRWELRLVSHRGVRPPEFRRLVRSQTAGSPTGAPPGAGLSVPKGDRTCWEQQSVGLRSQDLVLRLPPASCDLMHITAALRAEHPA